MYPCGTCSFSILFHSSFFLPGFFLLPLIYVSTFPCPFSLLFNFLKLNLSCSNFIFSGSDPGPKKAFNCTSECPPSRPFVTMETTKRICSASDPKQPPDHSKRNISLGVGGGLLFVCIVVFIGCICYRTQRVSVDLEVCEESSFTCINDSGSVDT